MILHLSHQARLSGNKNIKTINPLAAMVRGFILMFNFEKKGGKRARCEKTEFILLFYFILFYIKTFPGIFEIINS